MNKGKNKQHTPNEEKSIVKNPNNSAHDADKKNRELQKQPNNPAHPKHNSQRKK
jgi:hypothetical protein